MITESSSVPDTPSTMQWWVFDAMAQRSPLQPIDHPDLPQRLGPVELLGHDPAHQVAELGLAARGGSAVWRTWYSMLKWGSSTQTGRPRSTGHSLDHLPVAGHEPSLPAIMATRSLDNGGAGPSKIPMEAMCMWLTPSSMCRKEESSGLSRSCMHETLLGIGPGLLGPGLGRLRAEQLHLTLSWC